jgi:hypothetical protein
MPSLKGVFGNKRGRGTILVSTLLLLTLFLTIFTIAANNVSAVATSPTLGAAANFGVLGHTTVTNTGATTICGNLGDEGGHTTDLADITIACGGADHEADAVAGNAQVSDTAAFGALDQSCDRTFAGIVQDLVGFSLGPGVYCAASFALSGTLTLTGSGVWIFKAASALSTSGTANVVGGDVCNVWWRVASSATLGTNTQLTGNILALTSISLQTGARLTGRALVQTGAVTLDHSNVNASNCANTTTITTVIGGVTTTIVLLLPVVAKPLVAPVPVGGVMLPSVGFTVLLPWAIALSMLGVLSLEAFTIKRRAKRR